MSFIDLFISDSNAGKSVYYGRVVVVFSAAMWVSISNQLGPQSVVDKTIDIDLYIGHSWSAVGTPLKGF